MPAMCEPDSRVWILVFLVEISAHRPGHRMQRRIVQRRRSGDTSNSIRAEILFGHKKKRSAVGRALAQKSLAQRPTSLVKNAVSQCEKPNASVGDALAPCVTLFV